MNRENEVSILDVYIVIRDFIKRRWLWLLIAGILGATFGYVKMKIQKDVFRSDIVISSGVIPKEELYSVLLPIVNNVDEKPVKKLNRFFETDDKTFASVQKFAIDTMDMKSGIVIHLQLTDTSDLEKIQAEVSDFYKNRSGFTKTFEEEKALNQAFFDVLNQEISELNDLQEKVLEESNGNAVRSIVGTHEELIALYEKRIQLERRLSAKSPVEITYSKHVMPVQSHPLKKMVAYSLIFGFIMLIFLIVAEFERAIRKRRASE